MIQFEITTPERVVYKDEIDSVTIPTKEGEITVLPNHIPLVAILKPGVLVVRKGEKENYMAVSGGFIEVQSSFAKATDDKLNSASGKQTTRVIILADTADRAEELTLEAVEAAREKARKMLEEKKFIDDVSYNAAAGALERELARLKVVHKHRSHRGPTISSVETDQES